MLITDADGFCYGIRHISTPDHSGWSRYGIRHIGTPVQLMHSTAHSTALPANAAFVRCTPMIQVELMSCQEHGPASSLCCAGHWHWQITAFMLAFVFMFSVVARAFIYNWQESPSSNVVGLVVLVKKKTRSAQPSTQSANEPNRQGMIADHARFASGTRINP